MKIVILDGKCLNPGDLDYGCLEKFGTVTLYDTTEPQDVVKRIADNEIVLVNKVNITPEILDACPSIRYIGVQATGFNVVDIDACRERGIPVTNVPTYGTAAVAQFTMALLLELCHQIGTHNTSVHQGDWEASPLFCYWLTRQTELAGLTFGAVGFGRIGRAAATLAKAFGMRVLAYNRSRCPEGEAIGEYVDLNTLLRESDVVSLHCPQTSETTKMINRETLSKMKDGAMLINTSRGGLIDEEALAEALKTGKLSGAAVDVVSHEPMEHDNPLLTAPNCIITPHIAWAPTSSRQRLLDCVVDNIEAWIAGKPQNVVNGL